MEPSLLLALKQRYSAELMALTAAPPRPNLRPENLTAEISDRVDQLVLAVAEAAAVRVEETFGPSPVRAIGLYALGSYGRRELCPKSDVDLLFLLPPGAAADLPELAAFVDAVLYALWDLGLEIGHAVRTLEECEAALEDHSVLSGLFDLRLLPGGASGAAVRHQGQLELEALIAQRLRPGPEVEAFVAAKLEEAQARQAKFGTTVFLLEPNVKESEGGLRDWHFARWIARARFGEAELPDLLRLGALSPTEAQSLTRAYGFLLQVRVELHRLTGRRQDVLGFQHQEQVAARLGYLRAGSTDHDQKTHGIERFMRGYYFHARNLRHLSGLVVARAQAEGRQRRGEAYLLGRFRVSKDHLTVQTLDQFRRDPVDLLRIFRIAQEEALPIDSYTKNQLSEQAGLIDRRWRREPAMVEELFRLLEDPKADGALLEELHDLGIWRRLFPEVSRITARWQHSLYHVYTVDAHSLFVVRCLKRLVRGDEAALEPELTKVAGELTRPRVLYLAGFFHDIGKGWPRGDHSRRGAMVAKEVGRRLEAPGLLRWSAEETADLAWLVEEHLTLSDTAQRRDLSDPALIQALAQKIGSGERLTMLLLLTYADMKSTSPKVWTTWKRALLLQLHERVKAALEEGPVAAPGHKEARRQQAITELAHALGERGEVVDREAGAQFVAAVPDRYLLSVRPRHMARHFGLWRRSIADGRPSLHLRHLVREDASRLTLSCPDRPGLLAVLAGVLAAHRLQILSAEIYSMEWMEGDQLRRGALDVLWIKDEAGHAALHNESWTKVEADLVAALAGQLEVQALVEKRSRPGLPDRPRPWVKSEVVISNRASQSDTVIDVYCRDRIGVLYTIARVLAAAGLSINLAKISTQGDRVADAFYVTDVHTGAKIEDPAQLLAVERELLDALERLS